MPKYTDIDWNNFPSGSPEREAGGARFVADVGPYEYMTALKNSLNEYFNLRLTR